MPEREGNRKGKRRTIGSVAVSARRCSALVLDEKTVPTFRLWTAPISTTIWKLSSMEDAPMGFFCVGALLRAV